jgi:rhodanese-related sulfurtransferase
MTGGRGSLAALVLLAAVAWSAPAHAGHGNAVMSLDADYVLAQYAKGRKLTAIDLRSEEAYGRGHLPGARSLPLDQLTTRFAEVPRTDLVVLYCDCTQSEVEVAYWFLRGKQYRNLSVLERGFATWVERGHPVEK